MFNFAGENLLKTEDVKLNYDDKNKLTHLYTLVVKPDNTYEVRERRKSGWIPWIMCTALGFCLLLPSALAVEFFNL